MGMSPPFLDQFAQRLEAGWPHIFAARSRAQAKKTELRPRLVGMDSEDTSIVVFGSLARDEFTEGSDIDWTFLIDGLADPKHFNLQRSVEAVINEGAAKPVGREGTFGGMAFSHEIVHQIGGQEDTNRNTTRRVLLLLESEPIGRPDAYKRVVTNLLKQYILPSKSLPRRCFSSTTWTPQHANCWPPTTAFSASSRTPKNENASNNYPRMTTRTTPSSRKRAS
jgi:predicted nucleotidyltransferase